MCASHDSDVGRTHVSAARYKRTGLYEVGSSCTGAPSRLRSRWRRRSLTDAAYPLRVRALRRGCDRRFVGHDDLGVPTAKRQTVQTNGFVQGWQFLHTAGTCPRPTIQIRAQRAHHRHSPLVLSQNGTACTRRAEVVAPYGFYRSSCARDAGDGVPYGF